MNGSAPYLLCVGSHVLPVTKPRPSLLKIGHACFVVKYAISARIASTERPAPNATTRNDVSIAPPPDRVGSPFVRVDTGSPAAIAYDAA
jgi:hypothetical protein